MDLKTLINAIKSWASKFFVPKSYFTEYRAIVDLIDADIVKPVVNDDNEFFTDNNGKVYIL